MKKIILLTLICIFIATPLIATPDATSTNQSNEDSKKIVVEIDYGNVRQSRTIEMDPVKGMTALELLQNVARVETHPVGEHVIVVSIDGVKGKRGDMGWYYTVNGKSADKLAYHYTVDGADHVQWNYKKDVCSITVDK